MRAAFIIVMVIVSLQGYTQQNFEGSIKFESHSTAGDSLGRCEIIFGKTKMKTSWWTPALEGEETLREYQVYDFDKAVLYLVNPAQKWVKVDSFTGKAAQRESVNGNNLALASYCFGWKQGWKMFSWIFSVEFTASLVLFVRMIITKSI